MVYELLVQLCKNVISKNEITNFNCNLEFLSTFIVTLVNIDESSHGHGVNTTSVNEFVIDKTEYTNMTKPKVSWQWLFLQISLRTKAPNDNPTRNFSFNMNSMTSEI